MKLNELVEHPEGGRFKEIFRSNRNVKIADTERTALTHIYFSLNLGEVSRFHRVKNDEVWNLYEGEGLLLYIWDADLQKMEIVELSKKKKEYCCVIPAGKWQAAEPIQETILAGCSVAPGFEFEDFELIDPSSETAKNIISKYPHLNKLVNPS